jgi:hypothetical protein
VAYNILVGEQDHDDAPANAAFRIETHFGTPLGCYPFRDQNRTAMLTPKQAYLKLKRQAKRLMLTGDVERYMHSLRALNELRMLQTGKLAG